MKRIIQKIKGNDGAALITALLFLVMLTLLGVVAIWTSSTETSLGGNERLNKQAFYLAESGLQEAIARLDFNDSTNPTYYIDTSKTAAGGSVSPPWTQSASTWGTKGFIRNDGFTNYSVSIVPSFENDLLGGSFHQYTSAPPDQLILYNKGFGYWDSPIDGSINATGGFPVFHVTSVGRVRDAGGNIIAMAKVQADVTKNTINVNTKAGLQLNGCTNIGGTSDISAPGGELAVYTPCTDDLSTNGNVHGSTLNGNTGAVFTPMSTFLGPSLPQLRSMATISYTGGSTQNGVSWGDFAGETNPQIIFIDNACKYTGPGCHSGPFHLTGNGSGFGVLITTGDFIIDGTFNFKGLVFVLGDFSSQGTGGTGGAQIIGSVVVGGTSYISATATGNSAITLDRDILQKVAQQGFTSKIVSWKEIRE